MNIILDSLNYLLMVVMITSLVILSSCQKRSGVLVKDSSITQESSPSIAIERTGLDGEYDLSGLAKRVAQAFEEDSILNRQATVYVAQNNHKIIVKGTIADSDFLNRLENIALSVPGVQEVDLSQVEIR